jgi:tetratricopeptide (TPR) repeat protein
MRLGDILVARGLITRDALHEYVRVQVEETVYLLYTWHQGTFHFDAGLRPPHEENLVAISPESLLLEGARRVDEWALIQKSIPTLDLVFEIDQRARDAAGASITDEQRHVLAYVDGKRDVTGVADESGLSEFDVGKALHELRAAGVVLEAQRGAKQPLHAAAPARVDEHWNLGVAFYRATMFDEAQREFLRVLELDPDNVHARAYNALILMRQGKWEDAGRIYEELASVAPSAATLHNLGLALERLGRFADARTALKSASKLSGGSDARVQTSLGAVSLLLGEASAADAILTGAKVLWSPRPSASWYHYSALAAAWLGQLDRAQVILEEGLVAHPKTAVLHNNLAALQERRGAHEQALALAKRGVVEDQAIPQLYKNIGDLYYRNGRHDEAYEAFQQSVALDPMHGSDVYLKLGNILLKKQKRAEASAAWQRALELDPNNAIVRNNLGALERMSS